jgi:uncharacterized protein YigE (DUF2233 family)
MAFGRMRRSLVTAKALLILLAVSLLAPMTAAAAPTGPCETQTFEGSRFTVCRYDRGADTLRLALNGPRGPLGGFQTLARYLGRDQSRVLFAMNAGMYDKTQAPVGLLVMDGHAIHAADTGPGDGNFYLDPNGVFFVDASGGAHIAETNAFVTDEPQARWASQSGPLLVEHGALHPKIAPDGVSKNIRNGVGLAGPDQAFFVISDTPVSLGRFARFFRDALNCPDALYFDGHISALWAPSLGRQDTAAGLGPLVVVLKGEKTGDTPSKTKP